jgi:hypothetical protein
MYVETSLTIDAADLVSRDPTDLRAAVEGSVTVNDPNDGASALRVTQIAAELHD